jgi:hypothetical protein
MIKNTYENYLLKVFFQSFSNLFFSYSRDLCLLKAKPCVYTKFSPFYVRSGRDHGNEYDTGRRSTYEIFILLFLLKFTPI